MKLKFIALVSILSIMLVPTLSNGNVTPKDLNVSNYVIIGAFAIHNNAARFAANTNHTSNRLKLNALYEFNPNRNLFYVYVLSTQNQEEAVRLANQLRSETKFSDAWVYHGFLGNLSEGEIASTAGVDINPSTEKNIETVRANDLTAEKGSPTNPDTQRGGASYDSKQIIPQLTEKNTSAGKNFVFKLFRATDNHTVDGNVDVIDVDRSRKVGTYKSNMSLTVAPPLNKSGRVSFVCKVFGYRKMQYDLDYNKPEGNDILTDEDGNFVVPFELVRLQKGDISVMYNVYFYNDAGIMRPESHFEISSLLQMMIENPKYKIKIHGHTNGGAIGKILSIGDSKDFFSLNGAKESIGSSKELSEERANVVRDYLIANGIDASRLETKAWGGTRPIYDKNGPMAKENVRVEIEILDN